MDYLYVSDQNFNLTYSDEKWFYQETELDEVFNAKTDWDLIEKAFIKYKESIFLNETIKF